LDNHIAKAETDIELTQEKIKQAKFDESAEIYQSDKCKECNFTGYQGRIGIYELFEIDSEMEKLILKSPPISEVQELAVKKGMTTLLQDGLLKVLDGITSVEEVMRVVGE